MPPTTDPNIYQEFVVKEIPQTIQAKIDHFGITAEDGTNTEAFMGIELQPDALASVTGKFYEADVFGDRPQKEVDEYDSRFPAL